MSTEDDALFDPIGGGGAPIGGGKFILRRSGRKGIHFRLQDHPQHGDQDFLFEPIGGGPVILGGTGRSKGRPTKVTLVGRFVPEQPDDSDDDD